ncbi:MAG: phenylalanine--tRNA ligase subunit beta [bacterium]
MLISYNWLKEYVDFDFSPTELADKLTNLGFETANVERVGDDTMIDLEITVNRGDCLSMIGIAREISALNKTKLKIPSPPAFNLSKKLTQMVNILIVDPKLCPRYTGRIIEGVKVAPSPVWLRERLEKVGIRSINNIVDITNFVMMELGHPLHAFDYQTLMGKKVIICRAAPHEKILTLDGVIYELSQEMLIIADAERPIALAGIIGGEDSRVKEETTTILLECAYFNPQNIRQTTKQLQIQTESSYRFERGVDPEDLILVQNRATQLITEICGGKSISPIIDVYPKKFKKTIINLRIDRINRILGTSIKGNEVKDILQSLGYGIKEEEKGIFLIEVPSFKHLDITREIDIIEEIAQIYGYEKIPITLPAGSFKVAMDYEYELSNKAKQILVSCGFYEVITYSFTSPNFLAKTKIPLTNEVIISNPLRGDENLMCPSLIPNILKVLQWNINRDNYDLKVFELGKVFSTDKPLPKEQNVLIGAIAGNYHEANWRHKTTILANFYDLKGVIEKLLQELCISGYEFLTGDHASLHPTRQTKLVYQDTPIGIMGELHPQIAAELKLPEDIYLFELNWDKLLSLINLEKRFKPLHRFPAVVRDMAILVKDEIDSSQITKIIEEVGEGLIERIKLFDLYQGDKIPTGYKSLAYSITYRKQEITLTDEEVNERHNKIIIELKNRLGVELRLE